MMVNSRIVGRLNAKRPAITCSRMRSNELSLVIKYIEPMLNFIDKVIKHAEPMLNINGRVLGAIGQVI